MASSLLRPITVGIDARVSFYLISPEDEDAITAAATVEAKTETAAATKGDDAASAAGTSTDAEDDALFGDGEDGQDEIAAENKKRKRESQGKGKQAIIESKVIGKHQDVERELAQRYEKRRRAGEVGQIPEEEDEAIPDEVSYTLSHLTRRPSHDPSPLRQAYTNFKFHRDYQTGDPKDSEITNHYVFVLDNGQDVPAQSRAEKEFVARRAAELDGKDADTVAAIAQKAASETAPTRSTAYWHPVSFRHNLPPPKIGGPEDVHTLEQYRYFVMGNEITGGGVNTLDIAVLFKTLVAAVFVTIIDLAICYPVAYLLAQSSEGSAKRLLVLALIVPFWVNEILRAFAFRILFGATGVINGAGINSATPFLEIPDQEWEQILSVNLGGVRLGCQVFGAAMLSDGGGGSIINIASLSGITALSRVFTYSATKAAVINLTRALACSWANRGVRVNAIAPGVVDGEHWDGVDAFFAKYEHKAPGQKRREVGEAVPYGRMGRAEDLTGMAVFLASDEAEYIVAQTYNVDGGNWMS